MSLTKLIVKLRHQHSCHQFLNCKKTLCALGEKCCRNNPEEPPERMDSDNSKFKPVSTSQEPIFPPALRVAPTDTSYVFKVSTRPV